MRLGFLYFCLSKYTECLHALEKASNQDPKYKKQYTEYTVKVKCILESFTVNNDNLVTILTKIKSNGWDFKAFKNDTKLLYTCASTFMKENKIEINLNPKLLTRIHSVMHLQPFVNYNHNLNVTHIPTFLRNEPLFSLCLMLDAFQSLESKEFESIAGSWSAVYILSTPTGIPFGFLVNEQLSICIQLGEDDGFEGHVDTFCKSDIILYTSEDVEMFYEMSVLVYTCLDVASNSSNSIPDCQIDRLEDYSLGDVVRMNNKDLRVIDEIEKNEVGNSGTENVVNQSVDRFKDEDEIDTTRAEIEKSNQKVNNIAIEKNSDLSSVKKKDQRNTYRIERSKGMVAMRLMISQLDKYEWIMLGILPVLFILYQLVDSS